MYRFWQLSLNILQVVLEETSHIDLKNLSKSPPSLVIITTFHPLFSNICLYSNEILVGKVNLIY